MTVPRFVCRFDISDRTDPEECVGVDFQLTERDLTEFTLEEMLERVLHSAVLADLAYAPHQSPT
jgi:hypothetical protein